ncbi:MAG: hypothetical protein ABIH46_12980, partial [Chloroflexota bacterium]
MKRLFVKSSPDWGSTCLAMLCAGLSMAALLAPGSLVGFAAQSGLPQKGIAAASHAEAFHPHIIRMSQTDRLILVERNAADTAVQAREYQRDEIDSALEKLASAGLVAAHGFDEQQGVFVAELSDAAKESLRKNPLVATIEPRSQAILQKPLSADVSFIPDDMRVCGVSSIIFAQVYSPFVWGRTNIGGLAVELTLEDTNGNTKGVPKQTCQAAPNNYVKIDRTQLYFETVFVDPNDPAHAPVMILPGDHIHVVTSGDDPSTP